MRTALYSHARALSVVFLVAGAMSVTAASPAPASVVIEGVLEQVQAEAQPADESATDTADHDHDHADHDAEAGDDHGHDSEHESVFYTLRLPDSTRVRVDGAAVRGVPSGSKVSLVATVPQDLQDAIAAGKPVSDEQGAPVKVATSDVVVAQRTPAKNGSVLSRAVLGGAVSAASSVSASSVKVVAAGQSGYTRAAHEVYAVSVMPRGVNASHASAASIRAQVAGASRYWSDQSGGGVTFSSPRIGASYTSSFKCGDDMFSFWNEAARRMNFTENANRHLVIVFPRAAVSAGCSYGLASIGSGPNTGGVVSVADNAWPVVAHELGHNLGLGHAKVLRSRAADVNLAAVPSGSKVEDYGDPYDVMAASAADRAGMLSSVQAANIGLLQAPDVAQIRTGSGTFSIAPLSSGRGVRAVKISDPITGEDYFVEYRTRSGRDALLYKNMPAGVRVLKKDPTDYQGRASVVLDATPSVSTGDVSWHIAPRSTFTSRSGAVRVTVSAASASSAQVAVSVGRVSMPSTVKLGMISANVSVPAVSATARADGKVATSWSGAAAGNVYDVRYRAVGVRNGKPSYGAVRTWYSGTKARSGVLSGAPGGVYQVSVRTRGSAGTSAWSPWATSTVPVDTTARGTAARGAWKAGRSSAYTFGTFHTTSARNASITGVRTYTNRISVVGARHNKGSVAHVYVDGKLAAKVNTYAARTTPRAVIASIPVAWGAHQVRVVNVPSSAARSQLVVDAFAYAR